MVEDFASRAWADNHHRLGDNVARIFRSLWHGFERLTAAQFDAPWERSEGECKPAR
jgi:hypothetical protein